MTKKSRSRSLENKKKSKSNYLVMDLEPAEETPEEIKYIEIKCPDDVVLFDAGAEWSTRDHSVYQMVASVFPGLMSHMQGGPTMTTCLVQDDNEEGYENLENASVSLGSQILQFDLPPASSSSSSDEAGGENNNESGLVEASSYGRRLELVRAWLLQNPDVSKRKLAKFLSGKRGQPLSESDRIRVEPPVSDSHVSLLFNGNRYEGRLSRLCLEGPGRLEFSCGAVYQGTFSNNTLCGQGKLEWPDGSYYEGGFHENRRHGYGLFRSADSNEEMYIGNWYQGLRHGKGCQYYNLSCNDFYEGDFQCNQRMGRGLRRWRDGRNYEGQWVEDVIQGHGVMVFLNGTYSGQWVRGQMHGIGTYIWTDSLNHSIDGTRKQQNISHEQCVNHPMEGTLPPPKGKNIDKRADGLQTNISNMYLQVNNKHTEAYPKNRSFTSMRPTIFCCNMQEGKTNHSQSGTQPLTDRDLPTHGHKHCEKVQDHPLEGTLPYTKGCNAHEGEKVKNHPPGGTLPPSHAYNTYEGSWRRGQRHGAGTLHNSTGMTFRGTWVKNKKHGPGVLRAANGVVVSHVVCVDDVMYLRTGEAGGGCGGAESVETKSNAPQ